MRYLISFLILFVTTISFAQKEFHVFPINGQSIKGSETGDGSLNSPWDLQTALSQSSERVNGGDIIWIHEGIYNGRFKSKLNSTRVNKFITVSGFKKDKVILDGNSDVDEAYVLDVSGSNVIYRSFEITYLGEFSRMKSDKDFKVGVGIRHTIGVNCKFQNLIIDNIPGVAIGSWKSTGGTVIEDCIIYNNGYQGTRGHGVGLYVQNKTEDIRLIRNNIIFNNYYKGIEVWSASSGNGYEFVKNVELSNNILFNNGIPSGKHRDNIIIATNDTKGVNIPKDIKVQNNVFYHNIDFNDTKNYGNGTGLTIGFKAKALAEDIVITDNIIIGKNNALNLMHIKSLDFRNNIVYAGYVNLYKSSLPGLETGQLKFENNTYYTRNNTGFRVIDNKNYTLSNWQKIFKADLKSDMKTLSSFKIDPVLKLKALVTNSYYFNIALLDKKGKDVTVDFTHHSIEEGMTYKIYDVENKSVVVKSGEVRSDLKITFPMGLEAIEMPLHNTLATKSVDNFGVYRIEFTEKPKRKSFFGRLFGWLF